MERVGVDPTVVHYYILNIHVVEYDSSFRHVRIKIRKNADMRFVMSVRLCVRYNSARAAERIFMEYFTEEFH
jgi:hypothetical protein